MTIDSDKSSDADGGFSCVQKLFYQNPYTYYNNTNYYYITVIYYYIVFGNCARANDNGQAKFRKSMIKKKSLVRCRPTQ